MTNAGEFLAGVYARPAALTRRQVAIFSFVGVLLVGYLDYETGISVSLSVIYAVPVAWAAWRVGRSYGYLLSLLSTVVWVAGDAAKGMPIDHTLAPEWNGFIRMSFYVIFVAVLCRLRDLQRDLEHHVQERTAALRNEIAERRRLETELMEVGERERRRIGQDLHDSLCQHLTGTALVGQALCGQLEDRALPEAKEARKIVDLLEDGIKLARSLAKGLLPVGEGATGLMRALEEFADTTSRAFNVSCSFECESPVLVASPAVATNMFRIAQEAVGNAIKHGPALHIVILLEVSDRGLHLCVSDDGPGISQTGRGEGLGLRIMADRAKHIGGELAVEGGPEGGTRVSLHVCPVGGVVHD